MSILTRIKQNLKPYVGYQYMKLFRRVKYSPLNLICFFFPMSNEIILISNPDFSCNTYELYRYMKSVGYDRQYQLVWLIDSDIRNSNTIDMDGIVFFNRKTNSVFEEFRNYLRCYRAKAIISCNKHYPKYKTNRKQINVYLDHGSPLKDVRKHGKPAEISCSYIISQAPFFNKYLKQQYDLNDRQIIVAGVPRNDQFFHDNCGCLKKIYSDIEKFERIIAWVPTFRISCGGERIDCKHSFPYGIPLIYDESELNELNDLLKDQHCLIILKPHPAADLSLIKQLNFSNIRLLYNDEMLSKGVQTNEFLACTDAMITDYSGIYYDYLLIHKPILLTTDDYDEYSEENGFVFEDPFSVLKGERTATSQGLLEFIMEVCKNEDKYLEERERINDLVNPFKDGKSSQRVFERISKLIR